MATHTFYLTDTAASSPGFFGVLQDGGTPPTAASTAARVSVGKLAVGSFSAQMCAGGTSSMSGTTSATSRIDSTTGPTAGTGAVNTMGDSYRTPAALTGTFASGNWTLAFGNRPGATMEGRVRCRVWKSASAGATSPTEITSGAIVGSDPGSMSSTTTTYTSSITWAAPSFALSSEFLFFQVEFQEQVAAGTSNTGFFSNRTGTETTITTTDLGAGGGAAASLIWKPQPFQHMIIR